MFRNNPTSRDNLAQQLRQESCSSTSKFIDVISDSSRSPTLSDYSMVPLPQPNAPEAEVITIDNITVAGKTAAVYLSEIYTQKKITEAARHSPLLALNRDISTALFNVVTSFDATSIPPKPFRDYIDALSALDLDTMIPVNPLCKSSGSSLIAFPELRDPVYFYHHITPSPETFQAVSNLTDCLIQEIFASGVIPKLCLGLEKAPSLIAKDDAALKVAHLLLQCDSTIRKAFFLSVNAIQPNLNFSLDDQRAVSGVSIFGIDQLQWTHRHDFLSRLFKHSDLEPHLERVFQAMSKVRFHNDRITSSKGFSSEGVFILNHTFQELERCKKRILESLRFLSRNAPFPSIKEHAVETFSGMTKKRESTTAPILLRQEQTFLIVRDEERNPDILYSLALSHSQGNQLQRRTVTFNKTPLEPENSKEGYALSFQLIDSTRLALSGCSTVMSFDDTTLKWILNGKGDTSTVVGLVKAVQSSLLADLALATKSLPEVFRRVSELPDNIVMSVDDEAVIFRFSTSDLTQLKNFYAGDPETVRQIDEYQKSVEGIADPGEISLAYRFRDTDEIESTPIAGASVNLEAALQRDMVGLLRSKVHNFPQFFALLKKHFSVTISNQGKGGHKSLHRGPFPFALSARFRSENKPLALKVAVRALKALRIPPDEFLKLLSELK